MTRTIAQMLRLRTGVSSENGSLAGEFQRLTPLANAKRYETVIPGADKADPQDGRRRQNGGDCPAPHLVT
jgi:hypothetical protein